MMDERRKHERSIIDGINLPFLGTKEEDHMCFQYILMDVSGEGLKIAVPKWVVNREKIRVGDIVNFHIPFEIRKNFYSQGTVVWTLWDSSIEAQVCGVAVKDRIPVLYPVFDMNSDNLLVSVIKDSVFLKKGVMIYVTHLIPFFSRITQYPKEQYPELKSYYLNDIGRLIKEHQRGLQSIYDRIKTHMNCPADIPKFIDLEELRSFVESEISMEIFRITFTDTQIMPYLDAIKKLENKLYSNYNVVVLLYINALSGSPCLPD